MAHYTGYRQRGVPPARHRGLPSPFLTLIFTLDEPLVLLAHPDPRQAPGDFAALLGGLHSAPALVSHDGAQSGIQVALRSFGARALLGLPAGEPRPAATLTRPIWPGSSGRWPAARPASGSRRSSETSKPGPGCSREPDSRGR